MLSILTLEALSQQRDDNCFTRLTEHFADLNNGEQQFDDVKVIVLGNGGIGKTQISRRLCGEVYDPSIKSTHGVEIHQCNFDLHSGGKAVLNLWDFGGQDIYHGTHALFLKSRAIFVIVWTPESEVGHSQVPDGTRYKNESLSYWIAYVAKLGGAPVR